MSKRYTIFNVAQKTKEWFELKKRRITGTGIEACLGESRFTTQEEYARQLLGLEKKHFTEEEKARMNYGVLHEDDARKYYEDRYNVKVNDCGFAIPTWDDRLGGSPDGLVGNDGIIEIKCPQKMYIPLYKEWERREHDENYVCTNFDHIWKSHYYQMQAYMIILERNWCDYIVYCIPEDKCFIERVPVDKKLWNEYIYPGINKFWNKFIAPQI